MRLSSWQPNRWMPEEGRDPGTPQSVLIVEDDEAVLNALTLQLQARGWRITTTTDPHEALTRFQANPTTVALLDIDIPGLDAVELARNLRRHRPDLIVIMMTGYPGLDQAIEGVHQVAYDYLVKPFRIEQLSLIINRAQRELALLEENRGLIETAGRLQARLDALTTAVETDRIEPAKQQGPEEALPPGTRSFKSMSKAFPGAGYGPIASYERQMQPSLSSVAQGSVTKPVDQGAPAAESGEDPSTEREQPRDDRAE